MKDKVLTVWLVLFGLCGFNTLRGSMSRFGLTLCWLRLGFGLSLSRANILLSAAWAFLVTPRLQDTLRALRDAQDGRVARCRSRFVGALPHRNPLRPVA